MRIAFLLLVCFAAFPALAMEKVQELSAPGGVKALLIEDHSLPVITVKLQFSGSGAAYDPKGEEGLAYFASQMINEGAGDKDSLAFNRALENHAIKLDGAAGEDTVAISLQTLSEFKEDAFNLLDLALNQPRFDEEAVERVRSDILTEIRQAEENPSYLASLAWKKNAFPDSPYAHPRIGTEESVARIRREDLQQFQQRMLACSIRNIAIVGDITAKQASDMLAKLFPEHRCQSPVAFLATVNVADGKGKPVTVEKPFPQTVVFASLPGVTRKDPRYYALYLLSHIMGGDVFTSRLGHEIRDKRGLAYYADSSVDVLEHACYLSFNFATRNAQVENAQAVFMEQLGKMRDSGVTPAELDQAKRYITGSFPLNLDSQNSLAGYLLQMQEYALGDDYLEKRNSLIEAVTLLEINALAKELFSHPPLVVMVGQPSENKK